MMPAGSGAARDAGAEPGSLSKTGRRLRPSTLAAATAAFCAAALSLVFAPGIAGTLGATLAIVVVWIATVDARRFIIPNELTLAAFAIGLAHAAVLDPDAPLSAAGISVLRGFGLAALFWVLREAHWRLRGREGLGLGDVKLAAAMGVWLDVATIPIAIEIAAFGALAYFGALYVRSGRSLDVASRVPFGLFLAPAIWLGWLVEVLLLR